MRNVNTSNSVCASRAINFLRFLATTFKVSPMQLEVIQPKENEVDVRVAN